MSHPSHLFSMVQHLVTFARLLGHDHIMTANNLCQTMLDTMSSCSIMLACNPLLTPLSHIRYGHVKPKICTCIAMIIIFKNFSLAVAVLLEYSALLYFALLIYLQRKSTCHKILHLIYHCYNCECHITRSSVQHHSWDIQCQTLAEAAICSWFYTLCNPFHILVTKFFTHKNLMCEIPAY
jgi:hypothetical protein